MPPPDPSGDLRSTVARKTLALRGPNLWARETVLECWVEFPEIANPVGNWRSWLLSWLPGLEAQFAEADTTPTPETLAGLIQHITLHLQSRTDLQVSFGKVVHTSQPGVLRIIIQFDDETVARAAFQLARRMIDSALWGQTLDVNAEINLLRELAQDVCLGPSTRAMVDAAKVRAIPVRRLTEGSLVQLGWGSKQRRILAAATSQTSAIAEDIVQDKDLTRRLLNEVGLPVPQGRPVTSADDAWAAANDIGLPVVVKPRDGNQGRGVALNLYTREQINVAYAAAKEESDSVIVEQFAEGEDYRVLVIGRELVAASRRQPAHVIGDGVQTVHELIAEKNRDPRRAADHAAALSRIRIDAVATAVLAEQGVTPDSIPGKGRMILIRRNANLSTGGTAVDCTTEVHPTICAAAVEAAQTVGLDICGIDMIAPDITQPLSPRNGVIIELNARPGLRMHLYPSEGEPRPVGKAVIDTMFPAHCNGRIPVVAVTGVNGKTTTTRFIAHLLGQNGWCVGMTSTDGVFVGSRMIDCGDCSGPKSAKSILAYPLCDAAVLETARGGILREGLAFDHCDVAVVTNIGAGDHLGINEINAPEQLAEVKQCIVAAVSANGTAVLNAADPLVVKMADTYPRRTIFFALDGENAVITRHRNQDGTAAFVRDGRIIRAEGSREQAFMALAEIPLTHGGRIGFQIENTLASVAAAWALEIDDELIRQGARTFIPGLDHNAGRFNVLDLSGVTVIVDYGHNVDALRALLDGLRHFSNQRRIVVYTSAGDRRDSDIIEQGRMLGSDFDEAWLYEGDYVRGRESGEIMKLLASGLQGASRTKRVESIFGHLDAVDRALESAKPGDLVMIQADTADETVRHLKDRHGAK
ncbi:cyanophycin synthetase [Prosthecobacter sp.]|uniref:cyanophycin synthetase n=1 Tax=Prosthecobacter sp. TaxID=1965333 RepID=UPI001DE7E795|nr:cyanophycin synthetase [Prosthecobacter sp.]MCB1277914.1 cyanophycin synthetase [Prosthecobacter sp.]